MSSSWDLPQDGTPRFIVSGALLTIYLGPCQRSFSFDESNRRYPGAKAFSKRRYISVLRSWIAPISTHISPHPPHTHDDDNMAITFVDIEKADFERAASNIDLQKFNSAAPTLNNTPNISRSPSPVLKKLSSRSPTPLPIQADIKEMISQERVNAASRYTSHELDMAWMGGVIITCFFTSGLIDAVAFNSWNCFVGMQTGT